MSIEICSCEGNLGNLGQPGCLKGLTIIDYPIFLLRVKTNGDRNCVPGGTAFNKAFFDSQFENEDPNDRWYPQKDDDSVQTFLQEQGDPDQEEFPSGKITKNADGIVSVSYQYVVSDPYKAKAKMEQNFACNKTDVMFVDRNGTLIGEVVGGDFCGRRMQKNSLNVKVIPAQDGGIASKIEISFSLERASTDNIVNFVLGTSIPDFSLTNDVEPLLDVNIEFISSDINSAVFKLTTDWGDIVNPIVASGLTTAEIEVFNVTVTGVIALSGLTENPNGTYTAAFVTPQTALDVIRVQGVGLTIQNRFDLKRLPGVTDIL